MAETGPGKTRFIPNEDGSITLRRWNDAGWCTLLAEAHSLRGAGATERFTRLLAEAYQMGLDDKASIIKQAIGF